MSKQFWGVIVIIILVFVGIFALSGDKDGGSSNASSKSGDKTTSHTLGKGTTGVTLTEYGDYQCPYCEEYSTTVSSVIAEYGDQIKFQFANFPLTSLHRNAFAAARAAEAASLQDKNGSQDKFWAMHDALYLSTNWQEWTNSNSPSTLFNSYAQQIGLNVTQFKADFASGTVNDFINADLAKGGKLGVTGTPSFFVNGKKVDLANDQAAFDKVIKAAIAQKSSDKN
jgi:protein-disulfide isomerase